MFKLILLATIVGAAVGAAVAGSSKKCPWVMGKYPFDEAKMAGEWYVVNAIMDRSFTCGKFDYQVTKDAHVIHFTGKKDDGSPFKAETYAQPMFGKPEKGANMLAVWRKENGSYTDTFKQSIAVTDYENYAVFIACRNIFDETTKTFNRHMKTAILSRKPTLPTETVQVLKNVISGYDIDVSTMKTIENSNC